MATVFEKVQELEQVVGFSKHEQLVQGVLNAIDERIVNRGSLLPSVNKMVEETGFARKTIVKAYTELKHRGLIESKNRLGYFVVNEATEQVMKVALLIYAFHPFQEIFYNSFRSTLGENIQVDVFFHHSNMEVFETILGNISGRYGMYVVAPIPDPKTKDILEKLPRNKLLLVDRYEELKGAFSHITQEFENSTYETLKTLEDRIKTFNEIILVFTPNIDYPIGVLKAFKRFLKDTKINGQVLDHYLPGTVEKGKLYLTIGDSDLWAILKDAIEQDFEIGKDLGLLSTNNSPVKEIVCGGITTFSTDFEEMGRKSAEFILNQTPIKEIIPTVLIRRTSL